MLSPCNNDLNFVLKAADWDYVMMRYAALSAD